MLFRWMGIELAKFNPHPVLRLLYAIARSVTLITLLHLVKRTKI
jgi:hypothetical protein